MNAYQRAYKVALVMYLRNTWYWKPFYASYIYRGMDEEYRREWPQAAHDWAIQLVAEARTELETWGLPNTQR